MTPNVPSDSLIRVVEAKSPHRKSHWLRNLILLAFVALVVGATCYYRKTTKQPIDVENATPSQAISWLAMRDFSEESKDTKKKLFDYYFGVLQEGAADANAETGAEATPQATVSKARSPKLKLPKKLESASSLFFIGADKKVDAWARNRERPAYLRIDYLVRPTTPRAETTRVLSSDVKPGPALVRRYQDNRAATYSGENKKSKIEKNVNLLVMQWFVLKAEEYDATSDANADSFLRQTALDMEGLQEFYNALRESAKQNELTRVQLLKEFERQTEGWCEIGELDEVAKALWFKDLLVCYVVAREANAPKLATPPQLSKKARQSLGLEAPNAEVENDVEAGEGEDGAAKAKRSFERVKSAITERAADLRKALPFKSN